MITDTAKHWITNTTSRQLATDLCALSAAGLRIAKGEPQATETHSAEELVRRGYVGLYAVEQPGA